MKNKFFLWLSLLITLSLVLHSCRNEDLAKAETNPQRNNTDFFKHKSNLYYKTSTDYINILEAYNKETDFLSKMPDQKGMPIWDKMYEVVTENTVGLMIPLSYDDDTMSSILFATLDGKNVITGVKNYDNALLGSIVYNQTISKEDREKLFLTFIHMDNRTFGNEHFIGIPKDLFIGKKSDDEYGILWVRDFKPSSKVTTQQEGKLMIIETCFIALHCTHHGPGNICDAEDGCTECGTTLCNYEIIGTADDPFPSTPGGGGSGGGGGGGGGTAPGPNVPGPNVPTNPCGPEFTSAFYRLPSGCGGVTPGIPDLDDPCQKTNDILNKPNVKQGITNVMVQAKQTLSNINAGEIGFKEKKDGTVILADVNSAHQVVFNDVTDGYGGYHNHTATGIHMVSPPDMVDSLFGFAAAQSIEDGVGNAYLGMIAAEHCSTCPPDFIKYIHYVVRYAGTGVELGSFVYSPAQMAQFKNDYRKMVSNLTNTYVNGNTYINIAGDLNEKGLEKLFFDTLTNMGLDNKVVLQRVEANGTVYNVTKNSNGTITAIPCP